MVNELLKEKIEEISIIFLILKNGICEVIQFETEYFPKREMPRSYSKIDHRLN